MELTVKSPEVQEMFGTIAPKYDIANTVLSLGIHHLWKRKLVSLLPPFATALDLCTGTGDLLPLLSVKGGLVFGLDFCRPMLAVARGRFGNEVDLIQGDALSMPFPDGKFEAVTLAFGIRNFQDVKKGLVEIGRVLSKDGTLAILEFGQPPGKVFGSIYNLYSRYLMPLIGGSLTGNRAAYKYLPETASRFPSGAEFASILRSCSFKVNNIYSLTGGIAYIYIAKKC